jgi:hypothetical protein
MLKTKPTPVLRNLHTQPPSEGLPLAQRDHTQHGIPSPHHPVLGSGLRHSRKMCTQSLNPPCVSQVLLAEVYSGELLPIPHTREGKYSSAWQDLVRDLVRDQMREVAAARRCSSLVVLPVSSVFQRCLCITLCIPATPAPLLSPCSNLLCLKAGSALTSSLTLSGFFRASPVELLY